MQLLYGMVSFDLFTKKLFRLPKSLFHIMKFFYVNDSLKFYTYISSFIMTPIYAGSILFICKLSDFQTSYASNTISSIRLNKLLCFVFSWNLLIDLPSFRLATPISRTYQRLNSCNASITFVENFSSTVAFISMEFIDGEFCECMARAIIKLLYCHWLFASSTLLLPNYPLIFSLMTNNPDKDSFVSVAKCFFKKVSPASGILPPNTHARAKSTTGQTKSSIRI